MKNEKNNAKGDERPRLYDIHERLRKMLGNTVQNRDQLKEILPELIEFGEAIQRYAKIVSECKDTYKALSEACSSYALLHEKFCFGENGLVEIKTGIRTGDIDCDGQKFHFVASTDKLKRINGSNFTQDFLAGLPQEWTKPKLELSESAIKSLGVGEKELSKKGLFYPTKNVWSRCDSLD